MAIKIYKNIWERFPELKRKLVLRTNAGVYYAWKDGECHRYSGKEEACKGLENPLIIENLNDWNISGFSIKDFGDYLSVVRLTTSDMKVKSFTEKESSFMVDSGYPYYRELIEWRFYKNRTCLMVRYTVFRNDEYVAYVINKDYVSNERWAGARSLAHRLVNMETPSDPRNEEVMARVDSEGRREYLIEGEVDFKDLAYKVKKSSKGDFSDGSFRNMDTARGIIHNIHYIHSGEVFELAESTKIMIKEFYSETDSAVWDLFKKSHQEGIKTMTDLVDFCSTPEPKVAERRLKKKEEEVKDVEALAKTLTFNTEKDKALVFERRGDILYITAHHNGDYKECRHWYDKLGTSVLILNLKNKKKKFFVKESGEAEYKSLIPSMTNLIHWLEVSPCQKWDFETREYICDKGQFTDPIFIGSREEVLKGTLIELFEQGEEIPLFEDGEVPAGIKRVLGLKTLQDWTKYCPKLFWEILLGNNILEQILKGGMSYLAVEMIKTSYIFNAEKGDPKYWDHNRIGIYPKAKNLKKCFNLSIKQIEAVNSFIKERWLSEVSNPFSDRMNKAPLVPAIYKMDEVLGVQLNCLDLKTFESLLELSNQVVNTGYRTWFSWGRLSESYPNLKEVTKKLKPAEFITWLGKGCNLSEYNDYLGMRKTLKQAAEDTGNSNIFSERAFPLMVKPEEVHRLHEIVSKISFEYKDAAKAKMFKRAVEEAKRFEFEDKESEAGERMCVVTPQSVSDLVAEGTSLCHCVKSPMWIDAIAERRSVIMFVRRCEHKSEPFFTVELDPEGRIRQCHGLANCDPDTRVIKFLGRWAEARKGVLKESISAHYGALCAPNR